MGTLTGTIVDTATKKPIPDAVVTVTSPALQGEQTVVTDSSGSYRIPNLPPGDYTLRLESDGYKPYGRGGITLRLDTTIRVNAELLPEGLKAEEVVVVGKAPTVDVGSSSTGISINQEFINHLALSPPGGKGAASRSFESLAVVAPGAQTDAYGVSLQGTTSPENAFLIDGVSVSDPAFGILGTPLSAEFFKEVNIITGGYLPEYGKAIGGIYDSVLKSGGNEFHGTAWFNVTPGSLNGPIKTVQSAASTEALTNSLSSLRDFGADLGGPIVKDRLWFYVGIQSAFATDNLVRNISQFTYEPVNPMDPTCTPVVTAACIQQQKMSGTGANAFPVTTPVKSNTYLATQTAIQYIAKLTYLINQDHHLTLSVYGTPTNSGGNGTYAFTSQLNAPPGDLAGTYSAIGNEVVNTATDVSLKYSGSFNNKRQLLDVTLGYHHENQATKAADGSSVDQIGQAGTQANIPNVLWLSNTSNNPNVSGLHSITDFESAPGCHYVQTANGLTPTCPVTTYTNGGPGFIDDIQLDSYQAKAVFTDLAQLAGHHVIKAGVNVNLDDYIHDKGYSGLDAYQENNPRGTGFSDVRQYGFLTGPDTPEILTHYVAKTTTWSAGGFAQDSWQILDKVTLNFGLRYDAQILYGSDGERGMVLPNQISPRVGIIYDFTQQGRSKLFANYGRYFEGVPLDAADRSFPSEPQVVASHPNCANPLAPGATAPGGNCSSTSSTLGGRGSTNNPNQLWSTLGASKEPADPNIQPQSSDEFVVGGEYEIFADARIGLTYTHRDLHRAIEDMSRDEANTYFIGNPGFGIASDFPKAVRNYDAFTVRFDKTYANTWLLIASYTLSRLYGNYSGLFVPETTQLDPNITADFDLKSLLPNTTGPLPGDHTHQIKLYVAKDFPIPGNMDALLGLSYRGRSGAPESALGAHPLYGQDNVYIVPRGQGGTLAANGESIVQERSPWVHNLDARLGYAIKLSKDTTLGVTVDVYNLFDFQAATVDDPTYTTSNVLPCTTGTAPTCIRHSDGSQFNPKTEVNPNYGKPLLYQDPRQWRLGAKVTF